MRHKPDNRRAQAMLQYWSQLKGRAPTVWEAFARQPRKYWLANLFMVSLVLLHAIFLTNTLSYVFLGAAGAILLKDVARVFQFTRVWPQIDRVLNWQAVERELKAETPRRSDA